jgi:hypothetical protein
VFDIKRSAATSVSGSQRVGSDSLTRCLISALSWGSDLLLAAVSDLSLNFTHEWLRPLRDITEGVYASEADILELSGSSRSLEARMIFCTGSSRGSTLPGSSMPTMLLGVRNGV